MLNELDSLLQALPSPAFVFDMTTLEVRAANTAFQELLGYSREELIGMTIDRFRPADELPAMRQALSTSPPEGQTPWRYLRKDGTVLDVKLTYRDMNYIWNTPTPTKSRFVVVIRSEQRR
jgi:PAS domain S-box-containing protein